MKSSELEKLEMRSRTAEEQLVELRDRLRQDSDAIENQRALISNLEKIHAQQQEALLEASQELNESLKREKMSADRAQQIQKALDDLQKHLILASTEADQYKIRLTEMQKNPFKQ